MAFDPFAEEQPRQSRPDTRSGRTYPCSRSRRSTSGSRFSKREIGRLKEAGTRKEASRTAASAFFKLGSA